MKSQVHFGDEVSVNQYLLSFFIVLVFKLFSSFFFFLFFLFFLFGWDYLVWAFLFYFLIADFNINATHETLLILG